MFCTRVLRACVLCVRVLCVRVQSCVFVLCVFLCCVLLCCVGVNVRMLALRVSEANNNVFTAGTDQTIIIEHTAPKSTSLY